MYWIVDLAVRTKDKGCRVQKVVSRGAGHDQYLPWG